MTLETLLRSAPLPRRSMTRWWSAAMWPIWQIAARSPSCVTGVQDKWHVLMGFNQIINTLRPRPNGHHVLDNIFECIFLNERVLNSIQVSLQYVPKGPNNNIPALVQIMAWRRPGDSHYLNQWWLIYWCIYASFGLNELNGTSGTLYIFALSRHQAVDG